MTKFFKFFLITIFFFNINTYLQANEKIAFININYIINNSNIGKSTLKKLESINQKNIKTLQSQQKKIKDENDEIQKIKNVISKEELKKKVAIHKNNIKKFNTSKSDLSTSLMELKKKEMLKIVEKIAPLVQSYMEEKSIDVILKDEALYISKSNYNITKDILEIVNKKVK